MRFSLIVATLDRVEDVEALLRSLGAQSFTDFEVILVDQNADDRLAPVVLRHTQQFAIHRLRSGVRNLSHARNLGIAAATGDIIGFPDDDCHYPPDVLTSVNRLFETDSNLAVLTGPAYSPAGKLGSGRWQRASGEITLRNVWTSVIAFNLFVPAYWAAKVGGFDESFGVGARFGSGEETDLVIRVMAAGGKAFYDFDLRIIHPDKSLSKVAVLRAFNYGTGLGHVLRKHRISIITVLNFFIRPVGGLVFSLVRANALQREYYWETIRGRLHGFFARP